MSSRARSGLSVGQLLIVGFDGTEMSSQLSSLLSRIQPAGVILFARNIVNAQQTHALLAECQSVVRKPLFTCVDLEGGRVDRFRAVFGPAPSAADVFAGQRPKLFRRHGQLIGRCCRALGFNVDLAPVLDLAFHASRSVMSTRSVSAQPKEVIQYAREFLTGLEAAGVIGAGKHFPGLGEGRLDSHHDLPLIRKSFAKLWAEDLIPYQRMKRELPMVLVSHASYPLVTHDRLPATLSAKWVDGVLRRKIGYRGLVLSDDLEMGGVLKAASVDEAAARFIRAGGDLGLICHARENVEQAFETLTRGSERDARFRRRALAAAARVAAFKRKSSALRKRAPAPSPEKISRLTTQLWEFSEEVRLLKLSAGAVA